MDPSSHHSVEIEVDPRFRGSGRKVRRRRLTRLALRITLVTGVIAGAGTAAWMLWQSGGDHSENISYDGTLIQTDNADRNSPQIPDSAVFLNIRRDPMVINLDQESGQGRRRIVPERSLDAGRAPAGRPLILIDGPLFSADQTLQLTLPSTSSDLAAFQKRRASGLSGQGNQTTAAATVENSITEALALPASQRQPLYKDDLFHIERPRPLVELLQSAGVDQTEIQRLSRAFARETANLAMGADRLNALQPGDLVALRIAPARPGAAVLQVSFYDSEQYLFSLSQPAPGRFIASDDPWYSANLLDQAARVLRARGGDSEIRLKDALYTALLRNGLSSDAVGETMMMLSRATDLDRVASEHDSLRLLMSADESLLPSARLLFVSLDQANQRFRCYVIPEDRPRSDRQAGAFRCFDPDAIASGGGGGHGSGFHIPVQGIKSRGFGARVESGRKTKRQHNGINWAAPIGTPVRATAAGTVAKLEQSETYGNVISLSHDGGVESRYAHLDLFSEGLNEGDTVKAGQLIGRVGTTGQSNGPHLYFEIRLAGVPVDPLSFINGTGSGAVEALVNRIIQVESAGNARAKNSRSSATGLGQFISSTWIRMMKTYRPDLAETLSREDLLDLRFDPDLSRAMVTNLARENEAVLRSAGLGISPGRLYLAHFLGAHGAVKALRADPEATVLDTMGADVVRANPFLTGWTNAQMAAWADRKLSRVSKSATAPVPPPVPSHVKGYRDRMDQFLDAL